MYVNNFLVTAKRHIKIKPIKINDNPVGKVPYLKYLSSIIIITEDSKCIIDIETGITKAKQAFYNRKHILNSKLSIGLKKVNKTYLWSTALYGCENRTITKKDKEILEAFKLWCSR